MEQKRAGCFTLLIGGLLIGAMLDRCSSKPEKQSEVTPATPVQPAPSPHTDPSLSAEDLQKLTAQRQYDMALIEAVDSIANASSFAKRAEAYCHFYVEQTFSLISPGLISEQETEKRYAELLRNEPQTQEEEAKRQTVLRMLSERIAGFAQAREECQDMVTAGAQRIPDIAVLQAKADDARRDLSEINQKISGP
jgi:hypothetical protein